MNYTRNKIEKHKAEQYFSRKKINPEDIKSFCFMQNHKFWVGPSIMTLQLRSGKTKMFRPSKIETEVLHYLLDKQQDIPFENHITRKRTVAEIPTTTYQRPSLYMFYFFVLFITFMILGYQAVVFGSWWAYILGIISFGLSIYFIHMLMTRFCYLKVDNESLRIYSVGREIKYPYEDILKVNFDFAREQAFTHVMEILDKDYHYRLYYIGRVSRRTLNDIAEVLQSAGVDATCSLNEDKRFYQDKQIFR